MRQIFHQEGAALSEAEFAHQAIRCLQELSFYDDGDKVQFTSPHYLFVGVYFHDLFAVIDTIRITVSFFDLLSK